MKSHLLLLICSVSMVCGMAHADENVAILPEEEQMTQKPLACDINNGGKCGLPDNDEELRSLLTPEQYYVVKQNGTERPFENAYWDNHRAGIYVDVISGEPLFSSLDKFDSGTGWPSFTKPIKGSKIVEKQDSSHGMIRIEVRSSKANSHLGHLFDDGPAPTRMRYCINSASLRFVPVEDLAQQGYGEFLELFGAKIK